VVLPAFDAGAALDLIEREAVTATLGVPTMLAAIADEQLPKSGAGKILKREIPDQYWDDRDVRIG
jgi:acyl-CoA synthetase (AMP-forming)/AMP-acid ligase II